MSSSISPGSQESKNTLFSVLSSHRRRYVLYACNQADGETTLSDVAEQVAAWEYDKPIAEVTSAERKRVYTSIQQHHLSKLTDAGLIAVNGDRLSTTAKARNLDIYLEIVPEETIPWPEYYLGLTVIGGIIFSFTYLGLLPDVVTMELVAVLFLVVYLGSSIIHLYQSKRFNFGNVDDTLDDIEADSETSSD
ncbi:hypothetical protein EGH24_06195 [Halonotius terrestris]|uniref:DUF7344 domain-containing protein n=1 Tax=Halonotius terrestris TaxID=2487750 RepID=A0A8J8PE96_9EURY|nr:hypothetical protein [Halonotius terrestris]TQQ83019.1 hypothetical protein EGH24_06195 [Halonotius terrestris]